MICMVLVQKYNRFIGSLCHLLIIQWMQLERLFIVYKVNNNNLIVDLLLHLLQCPNKSYFIILLLANLSIDHMIRYIFIFSACSFDVRKNK